jgi:hypothetical protein
MALPDRLNSEHVEVLQDALTGRPEWLDLSHLLRDRARDKDDEVLGILAAAFVYDLIGPNQDGRRANVGGPYASMIESDQGTFPPRPPEVVEEVKKIWASARDEVNDPIVTSRISDLFYVSEGKAAYQDGIRACEDLLKLAANESRWSGMERAVSLARSVEIATELRQASLLSRLSDLIEPLVKELVQEKHPGPPMTVLSAGLSLPKNLRPVNLDTLMERVAEEFSSSHVSESAILLASQAASSADRRDELRRRALQIREDEARDAEGLAKVFALQKAIELAHRFGFTNEMRDLLREQQELPRESLQFEQFETGVDLPSDEIRDHVDHVVGSGATDIFDALRRLGSLGPFGGSNADIDREVDQQRKDFPLVDLFGHQIFHPETSAPTFIADQEEAKKLAARARHRNLTLNFYGGVLVAPMLDEALKVHGRPEPPELVEFFSTRAIGVGRAQRLARALELFWDRDFDSSAHVITPRIEAILRAIARENGALIVRPAGEGRFGGVVSLNTVLSKLAALHGEEPWLDYLIALLCDPLSKNLRNEIAHGLIAEIGGVDAALLIHVACHLVLVTADERAANT